MAGYRRLGRTSDQRKALLRDLVTDLIINERIETTEMKAKELRRIADRMVTLGKKGDLNARRQAAEFVRFEVASSESKEVSVVDAKKGGKTKKVTKEIEINALQKLFDVIAPRFAERNGGYTRIYKTGPRKGDAAPMAIIEFVE